MDDFLAKPVRAADLWAALDRVVAARPPAQLCVRRAGRHQDLLDARVLLAACGGDAVILEKVCRAFRARPAGSGGGGSRCPARAGRGRAACGRSQALRDGFGVFISATSRAERDSAAPTTPLNWPAAARPRWRWSRPGGAAPRRRRPRPAIGRADGRWPPAGGPAASCGTGAAPYSRGFPAASRRPAAAATRSCVIAPVSRPEAIRRGRAITPMFGGR